MKATQGLDFPSGTSGKELTCHNALRLDLNYRRKTIKNSNMWRLNNMLLNNQQITEEIKKEIKIYIEMNENENTTQNLWDTVKAVLRGRFIAI